MYVCMLTRRVYVNCRQFEKDTAVRSRKKSFFKICVAIGLPGKRATSVLAIS